MPIDAKYAATGSAFIVHFLPRYTVGIARTVGVLSGIVVLLELSATSYPQLEYPSLVQPVETWVPTVEFTHEAARLLTAAGKTLSISSEMQPIPGVVERGRTVLMENWMAPIRSWYNNDLPSKRYVAVTNIDVVAEIGISNYEIHNGRLLLQVHVKLIDPASGKLLVRIEFHRIAANGRTICRRCKAVQSVCFTDRQQAGQGKPAADGYGVEEVKSPSRWCNCYRHAAT